MDNTDKIMELVEEMYCYLNDWDWEKDEEIDLEEKYSQSVRDLGARPFIICVFRRYGDLSDVRSLMCHYLFVWKDFHYQDWKDILYALTAEKVDIYYFIVFCLEVLDIDIRRVIKQDKYLNERLDEYLGLEFVSIRLVPTSEPGSAWVHRVFRKQRMEATMLWKRFQEEGAPMIIDI